jgi:hypothetical protein
MVFYLDQDIFQRNWKHFVVSAIEVIHRYGKWENNNVSKCLQYLALHHQYNHIHHQVRQQQKWILRTETPSSFIMDELPYSSTRPLKEHIRL